MATVVPRVGYCLRSNYLSRRVIISVVFVALAAIAAAAAVPNRASSGTVRIESVFPAAGSLNVHSVRVRKTPNPNSGVVKVMHDFRPDYRPQEMFAVAKQIGSDGNVWYKISVPMRPNGRFGWKSKEKEGEDQLEQPKREA